jgi:hypothetical protein
MRRALTAVFRGYKRWWTNGAYSVVSIRIEAVITGLPLRQEGK